jgi:hypothetical protein
MQQRRLRRPAFVCAQVVRNQARNDDNDYNNNDDDDDDNSDDDNSDDDHNDCQSDPAARVDLLRVGEHELRLLRLARGQLRGERHLHRPQGLHRRCGLQQRRLRGPSSVCAQVVRDPAAAPGRTEQHNRTVHHWIGARRPDADGVHWLLARQPDFVRVQVVTL